MPFGWLSYWSSCYRVWKLGLQPDLVQQVENDLQSIMAGGTARDVDILLLFLVGKAL